VYKGNNHFKEIVDVIRMINSSLMLTLKLDLPSLIGILTLVVLYMNGSQKLRVKIQQSL
jgi:hypothetical protein